jgi:hypothetical protein
MTKTKTPKSVVGCNDKKSIPEELTEVWDQSIAEIFAKLLPKQQDFLLAYVNCWSGAEAYRRSHNPLAKNEVAAANGSRLISNDNISSILGKFTNQKTEALFLVQKTYNEAAQNAMKPIFGKDESGQPVLVMEQPDYAVRVKAAEAISKLHGLNQPAEVKHSGEVTSRILQINLPTRKSVD